MPARDSGLGIQGPSRSRPRFPPPGVAHGYDDGDGDDDDGDDDGDDDDDGDVDGDDAMMVMMM